MRLRRLESSSEILLVIIGGVVRVEFLILQLSIPPISFESFRSLKFNLTIFKAQFSFFEFLF